MAKFPVSLPESLSGRLPASLATDAGVVPVLRLHGVIASGGAGLGRQSVSTEGVEPALVRAFETKSARAVALSIDSPGGSPTQSEQIGLRIRQLAAKHELPVLAFCEDAAASGGYWLACAADEIFANTTSMIGSIGVVSGGFGFEGLMERLGVERRLYTTGPAKTRLDPFASERAEDVEWLSDLQRRLHDEFTRWVIERRGDRLAADHEGLFDGDVWLGRRALELGLVDGIGTLRGVLAERYPDAKITMTTPARPLLARLGFPAASVESAVAAVAGAAETRAWWARLGR